MTRACPREPCMSSALGRSLVATRWRAVSGSLPVAIWRRSTRRIATSMSQSMYQLSSSSGSRSDQGASSAGFEMI